ncbi:hypothetical protein FRB99_002570 [Tulasnella sp. 403]|nr:hypothetical protein FRB99_002570 [Tulasnella sp. 403]
METPSPCPPSGLICLPAASERVIDADEEIFLLYTRLAGVQDASSGPLGLGFIDSKSSQITVSFSLEPPAPPAESPVPRRHAKINHKKAHPKTGGTIDLEQRFVESKARPVAITSSTYGVGRMLTSPPHSVALAKLILANHYFPPGPPPPALFDTGLLQSATVVELGAGIGLLACVLSSLVGHYTATDLEELVPLIRKNVARCTDASLRVTVTDFDWVLLQTTAPNRRHAVFRLPAEADPPIDLVICCDCIYNPELVAPLISAIDYCTCASRTLVLVVAELREEDVLRQFLAMWLASGSWEIWRLPEQLLGARTIAWVGWKHDGVTLSE